MEVERLDGGVVECCRVASESLSETRGVDRPGAGPVGAHVEESYKEKKSFRERTEHSQVDSLQRAAPEFKIPGRRASGTGSGL